MVPSSDKDLLGSGGVADQWRMQNMVGHVKHVQKCLDLGADLICASGGEAGGHTVSLQPTYERYQNFKLSMLQGDIPTTVLIPAVAQLLAKAPPSKFTGKPVQLIAAGGLFNGQSLAAALMLGASAVWIGTRFILCEEAGASKHHQEAVRTAGFDDNARTIIFTGRPLRVRNNDYIRNWEEKRQAEIKSLTSKGIIPVRLSPPIAPTAVFALAVQ